MSEAFSENSLIIPQNLSKSDADFDLFEQGFEDKILWQKESNFHSITVCENKFGRFLKYGISIQAGIIKTKNYSGNIPYLNYFLLSYLLKKNAKKILVIGFGIGLLVKQFENLYENLIQIDAVDIEENILFIAEEYFNFKKSEKFKFHLQDALVYLRENKTKYDIIITDVAGDEGIDERFFEDEFFALIKKSLKKDGIFAFNSCANTDFDESENSFFGFCITKYKNYFKNFAVLNGKTSTSVYYRDVLRANEKTIKSIDVTNAIFIASDMKLKEEMFNLYSKNEEKMKSLGVDIMPYAKDLHKIYTQIK